MARATSPRSAQLASAKGAVSGSDPPATEADAAVKLLGYYNDYFDTPYPLPTLDRQEAWAL